MPTRSDGPCTRCGTKAASRPRYRIQRFGGGNYRRPGRWYWGQVCVPCAQSVTSGYAGPLASGTLSRYPAGTLIEIARLQKDD